MNNIKTLARCVLGPRLYAFYKLTGHTLSAKTPEILSRSHKYQQGSLESISDHIIRLSSIITTLSFYLSPVLYTYIVNKYSLDHRAMLQYITTAASILTGAYLLRGISRFYNHEYREFLKVLAEADQNLTPSNKRILAHIDSEFKAYPIDFKWTEAKDKRPPAPYMESFPTKIQNTLVLDNSLLKYPMDLILTIVMKTIGRRLIYPGSLGFLQSMMSPAIDQGRTRLVEECDGVRYKLQSFDGNSVDSMFIDRRGRTSNGDYLVIGCEGNGGFYEIGTILTPLESGYSVLGWNHPGFGGSTGKPYPDNDVAAIDTVLKFATDRLNFDQSKIIIYGWSIGGFTATWGAMRHPKIHGIVVDASFDHIIPLARKLFPDFMYPVVEMGIKRHFDLNNSRHLEHYKGPVLLIRRSQDEVISTDPFNSPPTNRANYLLIDLLRNRFPSLIDARAINLLIEYLAGNARYQDATLRRYSVNKSTCMRQLANYFITNPPKYPVQIGPNMDNTSREQMVLFLASEHLVDYDSVHCAPLPPEYFRRPKDLIEAALNISRL